MSVLGNTFQIIGDNISNVNTVGFKSSGFTFQDLLSQNTTTKAGTMQIGRGTSLSNIAPNFSQGTMEATGSVTDMAISGDGFFVVRQPSTAIDFYTRAGHFRFDKDGYLVTPEGYVVQGWQVDSSGDDVGQLSDIKLESYTASPVASTSMTLIANLDYTAASKATNFADNWDATDTTPMGSPNYSFQSTVSVYDDMGSDHDLTIYFDKGTTDTAWEYLITCDPSEDERAGAANTECAGLIGKGVATFSASTGKLTGLTLSRFTGAVNWTDPANAGNWTAQNLPADLSTDGYFTLAPEFISGEVMDIEFNLGSYYDTTTAAWANDALTTTNYAKTSGTIYKSTDGAEAGDLSHINVGTDGIITGVYTNGRLVSLSRVALAKFIDQQGLTKTGGNLYAESRKSGDAIVDHPGNNGLGTISPNYLEQSNVDIAEEFVRIITNQRGFQANSKIITTVDQMLSETINIKR